MHNGSKNKFKLIKYLEKTQVNEVLKNARNDNRRNYLILLTLWKTGMRCNELTHLKKKDIKKNKVTIRKGKGNKPRIVYIDSNLEDLLAYHSADMNLEDIIYPLSNTQIRNICHKYEGELNVHPHTFRHSFAIHCLLHGMNIRSLQLILGHSDLNTTAIYLDFIGKEVEEDYNKIEW